MNECFCKINAYMHVLINIFNIYLQLTFSSPVIHTGIYMIHVCSNYIHYTHIYPAITRGLKGVLVCFNIWSHQFKHMTTVNL